MRPPADIAERHRGKGTRRCETCNLTFLGDHGLATHKARMHPHRCPVCGRLFNSERSVAIHIGIKHLYKPAVLPPPPDPHTRWWEHGNCRDQDGDIFFNPERVAEALTLCDGCPVKDECLGDALDQTPNPPGVWGGTTQPSRRSLTRLRHGAQTPAYVRTAADG